MSLTFFSELEGAELLALLRRPNVIDPLRSMGARVSMAMVDLCDDRRRAAELLNEAGVALVAWLLLDPERGYWLNADNAEAARQRYETVHEWIRATELPFDTIGLDIEPPIEDAVTLLRRGYKGLWEMLRRRRSHATYQRARRRYAELVEQIRTDGFFVETYQFPLVVDERALGSSLLQRALGFVDVPADREVLMLYRSLLPPPLSDGLVDTYGSDAQAIALGITGGGVHFVLQSLGSRLLGYQQLLTDLRRARRYVDHVYVFSLEGCARRAYLQRLCEANLEPAAGASLAAVPARLARRCAQLVLRGASGYRRMLPSAPGGMNRTKGPAPE